MIWPKHTGCLSWKRGSYSLTVIPAASRWLRRSQQPHLQHLLQGLKADVRLGLSGSSSCSDPLSSSSSLCVYINELPVLKWTRLCYLTTIRSHWLANGPANRVGKWHQPRSVTVNSFTLADTELSAGDPAPFKQPNWQNKNQIRPCKKMRWLVNPAAVSDTDLFSPVF